MRGEFQVNGSRAGLSIIVRVARHSVRDNHGFLERRIRLSALGKNIKVCSAKLAHASFHLWTPAAVNVCQRSPLF